MEEFHTLPPQFPPQILELAKEPNVPQTQKQGGTNPTILILIFIPG